MELEQARQLVQPKHNPSPICRRRGRSPRRSRSRSPRHSISTRSPSHTRRSTRGRSPPRRNRGSWSPSSSEEYRGARNDRNAYGPFTRRIRDASIPYGLEKPPQMDSYDGTTDPDEQIENIEYVLTYRSVRGAVKCKRHHSEMRSSHLVQELAEKLY